MRTMNMNAAKLCLWLHVRMGQMHPPELLHVLQVLGRVLASSCQQVTVDLVQQQLCQPGSHHG